MALKRFLDWSEFAHKESAVDLFKESVRESLKFDFYGERDTFTAIALTDSYPLTDVEAKGLGRAFLGANIGSASKYKFKARIIDENSPHMFLPNPCDPALVKNKAAISSLIQKHTDILQVSKTSKLTPVSRGDIVEIQLHKNVFCYDLQMGIFNRILAKNDRSNSLMKSIGCETLPGLYGAGAELSPSTMTDPEIAAKSKGAWRANPTETPDIVPTVEPFMAHLISNLQVYLTTIRPAGSNLSLIEVNSNFRNPSGQAQAMYNNYNAAESRVAGSGTTLINSTYGSSSYMTRIINFFADKNVDGAAAIILDMQKSHIRWRTSHFLGESVDLKTGHLDEQDLTALMVAVDLITTGQITSSGKNAIWFMEPINLPATADSSAQTFWTHRGSSVRSKRVGGVQSGEHMHIELPAAYASGLVLPG